MSGANGINVNANQCPPSPPTPEIVSDELWDLIEQRSQEPPKIIDGLAELMKRDQDPS